MRLKSRLDKLEQPVREAWEAEWREFYDRAFDPTFSALLDGAADSPYMSEDRGPEVEAAFNHLMQAYSLDREAWSAWDEAYQAALPEPELSKPEYAKRPTDLPTPPREVSDEVVGDLREKAQGEGLQAWCAAVPLLWLLEARAVREGIKEAPVCGWESSDTLPHATSP